VIRKKRHSKQAHEVSADLESIATMRRFIDSLFNNKVCFAHKLLWIPNLRTISLCWFGMTFFSYHELTLIMTYSFYLHNRNIGCFRVFHANYMVARVHMVNFTSNAR
jgi:hypothetical protein